MLDPEVVFRIDAGKVRGLSRPPVVGADAVAQRVLSRGSRLAPQARPAIVNGAAGAIVGPEEGPFAVVGFTVDRGRITAIDVIIDREKLSRVAVVRP